MSERSSEALLEDIYDAIEKIERNTLVVIKINSLPDEIF
jgi:hypothetical protein